MLHACSPPCQTDLHVSLNSPYDYDMIKTCQEKQSSVCASYLVIITTCYNMNAIKIIDIEAAMIGMQ
jgi:hypothetical protein